MRDSLEGTSIHRYSDVVVVVGVVRPPPLPSALSLTRSPAHSAASLPNITCKSNGADIKVIYTHRQQHLYVGFDREVMGGLEKNRK